MVNIRPLSKELQQIAIEELDEDVSRIPADIQAIKDWLNQQIYIKARNDDQAILTCLRSCKFSLERTKERIISFYTMKTLLPEIFKNRDPFQADIQEILKAGLFLPVFTQKNPRNPRLFILNSTNYEAAKVKKEDIVKVAFMIADIVQMEDDQAIISGMQLCVEMNGLKMAQIWPPALIIKSLKFIQDSVGVRVKGMHMLNMPGIFERGYTVMKTVLSDKLRKRLQVHSKTNLKELYNSIPKDEFPTEYGGDGSNLQELTDFWKKKVESYAEWFKEDENYGTDEKLRPGSPKTQELFGIEGSFKKLDVD